MPWRYMTVRTFFLRTQTATLRFGSEAVWVLSTSLQYPTGTTLQIQLKSLEVYNVFTVITSSNNTLVTSGGTYTLPTGSPSASTLAAQITLVTGLTCLFDQASLRFTLTSTSTPFTISASSTCLRLLGFSGPRTTPSLSHTSDLLCNLAPPSSIDISTNFVVGNCDGTQVGTARLASIPVTGSYGDLIQYYEASPDAWSETAQDTALNYLRVALTDSATGTPLDLQGMDWSITLMIREVPPEGGVRNTFAQETEAFYRGPTLLQDDGSLPKGSQLKSIRQGPGARGVYRGQGGAGGDKGDGRTG
jgi:hypothetical protein